MAKATVFNPTTGQRKQVTVGAPDAFAGGFQLETPTNNLQTIKSQVKQPPVGAVPIPGAQFNTREKQQAGFSNIQPIGGTLFGVPRAPKIPAKLEEKTLATPSVVTPVATEQIDTGSSFFSALTSGSISSVEDFLQKTSEPLPEQAAVNTVQQRVQELLGETGQRGVEQAELQATLGVPEQTKRLAELNTQIAAKAGEFQSLLEQNRNRPIGSRIVGGTQDRLTRQAGIEVGTLASLAQATQGNISAAKQTAQETIDFQFAPIEAELKQQLQQLDVNFDLFDRADKKRAEDRKLVVSKALSDIEYQREVRGEIADIALEAAKNGADPETLKRIAASDNRLDAIAEAGVSLFKAPGLKLLTPNEAAALGVPYGTTQEEAAGMGLIPKSELTGVQKVALEEKLSNNFERYAKESRGALRQVGIMEGAMAKAEEASAAGEDMNAASQGILVTFQKILDPTSVVRESEYARSGDGQSLLQRIEGFADKMEKGGAGVTIEGLRTFVGMGKTFQKKYNEEMLNFARRTETQAENYNLNLENILTPDVIGLLGGANSRQLTPLTKKYSSLDALIEDPDVGKEYAFKAIEIKEGEPSLTDDEILQIIQEDFNLDLDTSLKGQTKKISRLTNGQTTLSSLGSGTITGITGSRFWKNGLDFVLSGGGKWGFGAPVKAPATGTVVSAKKDGNWGNSVVIDTGNGTTVRLSHLSSLNVRPGQKVSASSIVGKQGNTGSVLGSGGRSLTQAEKNEGRGTHLDITIKKPDGSYYSAREVAAILGDTRLS